MQSNGLIWTIATELNPLVIATHKLKPSGMSPTFEKLNLERLERCFQTTESAKRLILESKRLTQESHELIEKLHTKRKATRVAP